MNDSDPITALGIDCGCQACGKKTDNFYFVEYYMLPRKLVRKRHREKERSTLLCPSCYEETEFLAVSVADGSLAVSKAGQRDMNDLKCILCYTEIKDAQVYGVVTLLHMIGGSGIESKPLAFLCTDCTENQKVEF